MEERFYSMHFFNHISLQIKLKHKSCRLNQLTQVEMLHFIGRAYSGLVGLDL